MQIPEQLCSSDMKPFSDAVTTGAPLFCCTDNRVIQQVMLLLPAEHAGTDAPRIRITISIKMLANWKTVIFCL